jgi:hypothetical protein
MPAIKPRHNDGEHLHHVAHQIVIDLTGIDSVHP